MTSLIDVIFLLIIFFLCINQFQKAEVQEVLDLPESANRDPEQNFEKTKFIFNLRQNGEILLQESIVNESQISQLLTKAIDENPTGVEVWIRADKNAEFKDAKPVLKATANAAIADVYFKVYSTGS